jgi:thiol-disulfide isomerase/thioredoxin
MSAVRVVGVTLLAAGISIGTALFGEHWLARERPAEDGGSGGAAQIQILPDFRLPDLDGHEVASTAWAGKVLVLNYWASWCPPCVSEMPLFVRTQEALGGRGVQFVGVAIDRPTDVKGFIARNPVNYPILIGDPEAVEMSRRLGNRLLGMPFTVIFDRRGQRVFSRIGEITGAELQAQLDRLVDAAATPVPDPDPNPAPPVAPKGPA